MNKLAVIFGISVATIGCAPTTVPVSPPPPVIPSPSAVVVAPPKTGVVDMPSTPVAYPKKAVVRQKPLASVSIYPGSLRENIERIAAHYGWHQVVWDVSQDYKWVGRAQIHGENLSSILKQLLDDYPLQAVFYQGNHVLYIHPRTLK